MNINRVVLTGNLTKDPDTRTTPNGTGDLQAQARGQHTPPEQASGDWEEKANFFGVTVFGRQAESCGNFLKKGRPVAIDGRLEWSEYEVEGQKRQSVDIIAENVQFLGGRDDAGNGNGNGYSGGIRAAESDIPADTSDFDAAPVGAGVSDDDIPF